MWQSTSSRLACWEIKQMLKTNWKTNSPGRQCTSQASYSRLALSDRIIPVLWASWSSVKLIQHCSQLPKAFNTIPLSGLDEGWCRQKLVSCEKITSGCYDKEGNESSPFFLLNHKHTVLASHLSPQCLDAFHTAEEPTMLDVERFFFSFGTCMYWGRKAKATEASPSLGAGETAQCFGHIINTQPAGINPLTPSHLKEMCVRAAFHDTVCSSGRISLLWSCDYLCISFL